MVNVGKYTNPMDAMGLMQEVEHNKQVFITNGNTGIILHIRIPVLNHRVEGLRSLYFLFLTLDKFSQKLYKTGDIILNLLAPIN